jgi:hypothetical protein
MKKGTRYLLIAFLLCGCTCKEYDPIVAPYRYIINIENITGNITHEYLTVKSVAKNSSNTNLTSDNYYLNSDSTYFTIPPDYNTDSIFLCFENKDNQIDTVGLCYKRKLYIKRRFNDKAFDVEIVGSKIFYVSNRFNRDSSGFFQDTSLKNFINPIPKVLKLYKN